MQWNEVQKRTFLSEAHLLYARRGTRWALSRLLEIHCSCQAKIIDTGEKLGPFTFIIELPVRKDQVDLTNLFALVDSSKPAYTMYRLEFKQS
jgi:P2-related tail formation protein